MFLLIKDKVREHRHTIPERIHLLYVINVTVTGVTVKNIPTRENIPPVYFRVPYDTRNYTPWCVAILSLTRVNSQK